MCFKNGVSYTQLVSENCNNEGKTYHCLCAIRLRKNNHRKSNITETSYA